MKVYAIRKDNLAKLVEQHESVAAFSRLYDLDPTYIRQLLSGSRTFGEKSARNIELSCNLSPLFFDFKGDAKAIAGLVNRFSLLSDRDKEEVQRVVDILATRSK